MMIDPWSYDWSIQGKLLCKSLSQSGSSWGKCCLSGTFFFRFGAWRKWSFDSMWHVLALKVWTGGAKKKKERKKDGAMNICHLWCLWERSCRGENISSPTRPQIFLNCQGWKGFAALALNNSNIIFLV